ncbi:MAG: hypothetical protein ACI9CA_001707, partial [Natronomonas sp.]
RHSPPDSGEDSGCVPTREGRRRLPFDDSLASLAHTVEFDVDGGPVVPFPSIDDRAVDCQSGAERVPSRETLDSPS